MKHLIFLTIFISFSVFANVDKNNCIKAAEVEMELLLDQDTITNEVANAIGKGTITRESYDSDNQIYKITGIAPAATYANGAKYNYTYELTVNMTMNKECKLINHSIDQKTVNIDNGTDNSNQVSCAREIVLVCKAGEIDRCLRFSEQPDNTHQCVPAE